MTIDPRRSILGILAAHNLVQNFLLNEEGYVVGNLAVSAVLVGIGRRSGLGWADLGLGRPDLQRSSRLAAMTVGAAAVAATAVVNNPRSRVALDDERASVAGWEETWKRVLLRFPMGTALFEEVAFRGILPPMLDRNGKAWRGDVLSAGVFALWHLIPTARALAGNPVGREKSTAQRGMGVIVGSAVAGAAGLGFSWLRRSTGSLLAPWLIHASLNSISFLAGVAAQRRARSGGG